MPEAGRLRYYIKKPISLSPIKYQTQLLTVIYALVVVIHIEKRFPPTESHG